MIRMVHLLRRKDGVSPEEFAARWRDVHGPLVASHQVTLGISRHVQTAPTDGSAEAAAAASDARGGIEASYDGVAEYWWWSESDLADALESEAGRAAHEEIVACEREFADLAASPLWFAHEYPQVATSASRAVARRYSGIVRVHFAIRALPGLTDAEAQRYWLTHHGPLCRSSAVARGYVAYTQVHACATPLADAMRTARGSTAEPYLGHAEAWLDRTSAATGPEAAAASARNIADESNFIDLARSTFLLGKERVVVDRDWL